MLYIDKNTRNINIPRHTPHEYSGGNVKMVLTRSDGKSFTINDLTVVNSEFYRNVTFPINNDVNIPDGQYSYSLRTYSDLELESGFIELENGLVLYGSISVNNSETKHVYEK